MPIKSDLLMALEDEDFHDVTLVGTDGVQVPANKTILALRSPIWKKMFLGSFSERNSDEVQLNYPSVVLKAIVTYCFTDELDLDLFYGSEENDPGANVLTDEEAVAIVQLRDAANYLELFDLHKTVTNELGDSIVQKDEVACVCAVLNELHTRGEDDGPLWDLLCNVLEEVPSRCILKEETKGNKGIRACSFSLLAKLLTLDLNIPPYHTARGLQIWFQNYVENLLETESGSTDNVEQVGASGRTETNVQQELQQIADSLEIEEIPLRRLADIKPCPFFSTERLYKALALRVAAEKATQKEKGKQGKRKSDADKVVLIRGAGVECLNGTYTYKSPGFFKTGIY